MILPFVQKLSFAASGLDLSRSIQWFEQFMDEFSIDEQTRELFCRGNAEKWLGPGDEEDYELDEEEQESEEEE